MNAGAEVARLCVSSPLAAQSERPEPRCHRAGRFGPEQLDFDLAVGDPVAQFGGQPDAYRLARLHRRQTDFAARIAPSQEA